MELYILVLVLLITSESFDRGHRGQKKACPYQTFWDRMPFLLSLFFFNGDQCLSFTAWKLLTSLLYMLFINIILHSLINYSFDLYIREKTCRESSNHPAWYSEEPETTGTLYHARLLCSYWTVLGSLRQKTMC